MTRRNARGNDRRGGARRGGGSAPPTPWPLQMADLYPAMAWFDGSERYTLNAGKVSAHEDRINGGSDYTVLQATGSQQPTKAAVGFTYASASQTRLAGAPAVAAMIKAGPCTVFSRAKSSAVAQQTIWAAGRAVSSVGHSTHRSGNATTNTESVVRDNFEAFQGANLGAVQHVLAWQWTGTQVKSRVDGVASASGTPSTQTGDAYDVFSIGCRVYAASYGIFYTGTIDDVIVIPAAISDEQLQAGEAWLATRPAL